MHKDQLLRMETKQLIQQATKEAARQVAGITQSDGYRWTQYVVFGLSVFFVIWDVVLPLMGYSRVSDLLKGWAFGKGFVLAWVWGVLAGHLFLVRAKDARMLDEVLAISILVILSLVLLCFACFWDQDGHTALNLILLVSGCVAGHILWPQSPPEP